MAKKFSLGANTVEDVTFLKVSGVIDEDNTLAGSLKKIDGRTVVIDLSGVERINSCGVRDWVNWLHDLDARGKSVVLVRCSPCIVNQVNLVNNFVGRGMVKSFFAPYFCPSCDKEQLKLLQVEDFAGMDRPRAPEIRGDGCVQAECQMEFDDIEEAYFAFLPRSTGQVVDGDLQGLLARLSPSIRDRIKRLDSVQQQGEGERTPISGMYSPLTVTRTSLSINRGGDPRDRPAETTETLPAPKSRRGMLALALSVVALVLAGGLIAYVFLGGGG
ncbi:MAG: STAS domain-containing protein [Myxococcales bacterium]|nr:STAS domain-containing protein [Myxococcales bacterium]